jgi:tetratricopeptide (TPR) repeat protein
MSTVRESHARDAEIARLVSGELAEAETRRLLRHLLRCPRCRAQQRPFLASLGRVLQGAEAERPLSEAAYTEAFAKAEAAAAREAVRWAEEREWQDRLTEAARSRLPFRLPGSVEALFGGLSRRSPAFAIVESLLDLSREERYRDPQSMEALALSAVAAAMGIGWRRIDRGRYSALERSDLQTRALCELANAYRRNYNFELAAETLHQAKEQLEENGSGDPRIEIRLLDVWASLFLDQRRLVPAFDYLDQVRERYLELGEVHLAGRALIKKGIATAYDERYSEAAACFREGLSMIDLARDPKLVVNAQHNHLNALILAERYKEARSVLFESGLRQAFTGDPLNLQKLDWLEGKIAYGLGRFQQATEIFQKTQAEMEKAGRHYIAAMVGLELTAVYLRRGKADEAEVEAARSLETFTRLQVSYEARRAVIQLHEACRLRRATAALALRVVRYLQQLEHNPAARFELKP